MNDSSICAAGHVCIAAHSDWRGLPRSRTLIRGRRQAHTVVRVADPHISRREQELFANSALFPSRANHERQSLSWSWASVNSLVGRPSSSKPAFRRFLDLDEDWRDQTGGSRDPHKVRLKRATTTDQIRARNTALISDPWCPPGPMSPLPPGIIDGCNSRKRWTSSSSGSWLRSEYQSESARSEYCSHARPLGRLGSLSGTTVSRGTPRDG